MYELNIQNYRMGSRIYGILCIPKAPGKYPALLRVPGAVVLSKGIVGLAGINPLGMFCVCVAYRQRLPTLAAFYQSGKQADFICLPRTLAGFQLVLHNVKAHAVNQRQ